MMQSVNSARLAIIAQQRRVDTIANNIANINTYGFKGSRVNFKDTLYASMQNPAGGDTNLQIGNGVLISAISRSFNEGTPIQTGVGLDFCIQGDGFFTVANAAGELQYTRNGCFAVSNETDGNYLVTAQGYHVLDANMNRIKLPADIDQLTVSEKGQLSIGTDAPFATLNIASFTNNEGLEAVSDNCFKSTAASGPAGKAQEFVVKQGFVESSNVDLSLEMTKLIRAQRAFSLAGKALATANEMDGTANNMRA